VIVPAKDCIPFILLGLALAPIAFILLTSLRSFEVLALILLLISITFSVLFARKKSIKFALTASLTTFSISFALSFIILGFSLMTEQHVILEIGKIENETGCVYVSEDEMEKFPALKRVIEVADKEGVAKVSISSGEWKAIKNLIHGRCIIYKGEFYSMSVMIV